MPVQNDDQRPCMQEMRFDFPMKICQTGSLSPGRRCHAEKTTPVPENPDSTAYQILRAGHRERTAPRGH